jgi:hypothetical protein
LSRSEEIHTWFDIRPTKKELRRLADRGEKGNHKWYLDGKFVATAKANAIKALKRKLFADYKDDLRGK